MPGADNRQEMAFDTLYEEEEVFKFNFFQLVHSIFMQIEEERKKKIIKNMLYSLSNKPDLQNDHSVNGQLLLYGIEDIGQKTALLFRCLLNKQIVLHYADPKDLLGIIEIMELIFECGVPNDTYRLIEK